MQQNSDLIHFSRAGDIFHYRWAVKRSLKLLDFNTDLSHITIEGSLEPSLAGECVVDVAEYSISTSGKKSVEYFQLKHSTVQVDKHFTLSLLEDTIKGLSKRFKELDGKSHGYIRKKFTVITNRLISPNFKKNIEKIAKGIEAGKTFTQTIKSYTKLNDSELKQFCKNLSLCDSEGNYDEQKHDIHKELSKLTVSKNISDREKLLVAKIWEKIEPGKNNVLKQEDILEAFDVTDINDFFPASPLFEPIPDYVPRDKQTSIVKSIESAITHTIITASGGVGKSILSSNLTNEFNEPSIVVAYDCFGNGSYRRPSTKRHGAKDALVQLINTFAKDGLCDQIIPARNEPYEYWIKAFLSRIEEICTDLLKQDKNALLVIIFDAADNAEMAAEEFGEPCFVKLLLKEVVPKNCRLVFTCRPERLHLLEPPNKIKPISLSPFSNKEALLYLQRNYPKASIEQAIEFNRLTGGNPRVQSSALALKSKSLDELLFSFGSTPVTVEDLIERQLEESIERIKDDFPLNYRKSIDDICTGLATLPPFVPLNVLAKVANVAEESVRSFIADLGRPLWLIDDSAQFRDEPTETWFQEKYSASVDQVSKYVDAIKPLSNEQSYIAENLPLLLLKAERFDELVQLALSDDYLPKGSPFDARKVKIYRLQYAFKAALKEDRIYEASKLALRAGEEIAGNERQVEVLSNNLDLTTQFLSSGRIQELAHRKEFFGNWDGSETVYSASMLSTLSSNKGEANSYLRSANHWLHRYFDKRDEAKEEQDRLNEKLEDIEIIELATAEFHINGWKKCVDFLLSWSPAECIFRVTSRLMERFVDAGRFDIIELMANFGKHNPSFVLAITSELMKVGRTPPRQCLTRCLNQIIKPSSKLEKVSDYFNKTGYSLDAYLSFFESCLIHKLPLKNIKRGVNYYYSFPRLYRVADEHQYDGARELFLRYLAIQAAVNNDFNSDVETIIPKDWKDENASHDHSRELSRSKELIGKLLPWYMVKARILTGQQLDLGEKHDLAEKLSSTVSNSSYREYEPAPYEIAKIRFQNILFSTFDCSEAIYSFTKEHESKKLKTSLTNDFYYLRASCRNEKLHELSEKIEASCFQTLKTFDIEESPETYSESYITLARAVLNIGKDDAASYFDEALNKASNFGQEAVARWEALTAITKRSAEGKNHNPELAHRYMRCAEMIGDSVDREKYWDRNDALATCFQLSPESAFAIFNRWKERDVGWSDRQMYTLAHNAIDSKSTTPSSLSVLAAFSWEFSQEDFCEKCITQETSKFKQQLMLDQLIRDLRIKGTVGDIWLKISDVAKKYDLKNEELNNLNYLISPKKSKSTTSFPSETSVEKDQEIENNWKDTYGQFDPLTANGFRKAYRIYDSQRRPGAPEEFWGGCYRTVTSRKLMSFLKVVSESDFLEFYDLHSAFEKIPTEWKEKASVKKSWNNVVSYIASRFPNRFTEIYERSYFIGCFILDESTTVAIQKGIIKGLADSVDIESPKALFSFAHYSSSKLTIEQAQQLVNFGLARFEKFIDEDYADGNWKVDLTPPQGLPCTISSYIFANLGSPYADERWRAVHSVIRLYKLSCQNEVNLLIAHLSLGLSPAYIPTKYPFYELHAKLHLLIALTRCIEEGSDLLHGEIQVFADIALKSKQGILFQYYAKQICLKIEDDKPGSFDSSTIEKISYRCVSRLPLLNENKYRYRTESPWHKAKLLNALPDISFAHDFDRYWFEPLGRVFGISRNQVEDLAKDVLTNQWAMTFNTTHIKDPRSALWKNRRDRYDAHNDRSSYPRIDNYSFYLSYHLMLEVASKLIESMPVIQEEDEHSSWDSWLQRHLVLPDSKLLLSELRDPMPIKRRDWVEDDYDENWRWQITGNDFIDLLVNNDNSLFSLNVGGEWNEYKDGRNERISFSSILVPKKLSQSLLLTTINFENHMHECYLHDFCESLYDDKNNHQFLGQEWLSREGENSDVESNDPFAGEIYAQPFKLSDDVINAIEVGCSKDQKTYYLLGDDTICLQSKYWSEDKPSDRDTYIRTGRPGIASLEFLMLICNKMNVDIALQVNIERSFTSSSRNRTNDDELRYIPKSSKTFILSGDGRLRDTRKSYQLG